MINQKTYLNLYWSLRKYIYAQFRSVPTYYNPMVRPTATAEKFLIINFQEDRFGKLSFCFPRIFCVSKSDPELVKLTELVSSVIEKFASPSSGKKKIDFYDEVTKMIIGYIEVIDVVTRPALTYEEGFVHRAVDLTLRYVVEQRHL